MDPKENNKIAEPEKTENMQMKDFCQHKNLFFIITAAGKPIFTQYFTKF